MTYNTRAILLVEYSTHTGSEEVGRVKVYTAALSGFDVCLQHGKNFHRILKFMQTKYRKKNDPVIPNLNKDQVSQYEHTLHTGHSGCFYGFIND